MVTIIVYHSKEATLVQNHNPDLSSFPEDRHGYPTLSDEEWANWEPIRPIIAEHNYDIAHVFNSGWMRRVTNPDFNGNGNPAVAVIHKDRSLIYMLRWAVGNRRKTCHLPSWGIGTLISRRSLMPRRLQQRR